MKVVVTGKNGQLASELELLKSNSENWNFFDKNNLDISNINSLSNYFSINKTDVIINCAAYTKVDNAENFCDKAFQVNHVGVKNLIYVCQKFNIKLIHISTDYVFDGNSKVPYNENDKRNPINVYGQSKLLGENEILNSNVKSIIIRTSWLYSNYGNNFVKKILHKNKISVVTDEIGNPTYAHDLALLLLIILNYSNYNWIVGDIFNFSNVGVCSRYEFSSEIFKICNKKIKVEKITTNDLKLGVNRPKFSVLNCYKVTKTFGVDLNNWKESLKKMLNKELINS